MSLSRRQQKDSLKNDKAFLEQLLGKYEAILEIDVTLTNNVRGRKPSSLSDIEKGQMKNLIKSRNNVIASLPREADRKIVELTIPERIQYLNERIPIAKNAIEQKDASIRNLGSIFGNIKRSFKGGRTLRKKKGGRKSLKKRKKKKSIKRYCPYH